MGNHALIDFVQNSRTRHSSNTFDSALTKSIFCLLLPVLLI